MSRQVSLKSATWLVACMGAVFATARHFRPEEPEDLMVLRIMLVPTVLLGIHALYLGLNDALLAISAGAVAGPLLASYICEGDARSYASFCILIGPIVALAMSTLTCAFRGRQQLFAASMITILVWFVTTALLLPHPE